MQSKLKLLAEYGKRMKELPVYGALPEGYYLVVNSDTFINKGYVNVTASAVWHPKNKTVHQADYPLQINLSALYNRFSEGPKEFNSNSLNGATIHVKSCSIHEYEYDGVLKRVPKIEWNIISFPEDQIVAEPN